MNGKSIRESIEVKIECVDWQMKVSIADFKNEKGI